MFELRSRWCQMLLSSKFLIKCWIIILIFFFTSPDHRHAAIRSNSHHHRLKNQLVTSSTVVLNNRLNHAKKNHGKDSSLRSTEFCSQLEIARTLNTPQTLATVEAAITSCQSSTTQGMKTEMMNLKMPLFSLFPTRWDFRVNTIPYCPEWNVKLAQIWGWNRNDVTRKKWNFQNWCHSRNFLRRASKLLTQRKSFSQN